MGTNNFPPSAEQVIRDLQARVKQLEAASQTRVPLDTITGGALRVQDASGNTYVYIGEYGAPYPDGSPQYGLAIGRQTGEQQVGSPILAVFSPAPAVTPPSMHLYDAAENQIFGDDGISGFGLAVPYLSFPMQRSDSAGWPSTTSATMVDMYFSFPPAQQPKVQVWGYMVAPSGTNASIQLISGTTVLGSPIAVNGSGGAVGWIIGPVAFPEVVGAAFLIPTDLRVQASRTAGTGSVALAIGAAFGQQT